MAVTALTLSAERWLDEVILRGTVTDVAIASIVEGFTLPAGLGDTAIMSILVNISNIGTVPVTATMARGVRAYVISPDAATVVDLVGTAEFYATGGVGAAFTKADAHIDPDALCLFRQNEQLYIEGPEMDAGATGDLIITVKAVRVRPMEAPQGPIQLVR